MTYAQQIFAAHPVLCIGVCLVVVLGAINFNAIAPYLKLPSKKKAASPMQQVVELTAEMYREASTLPPQVREAKFMEIDKIRHIAEQSIIEDAPTA